MKKINFKNFFFKNIKRFIIFELVIAIILNVSILIFGKATDEISILSLTFTFAAFLFTLNDSNKTSEQMIDLKNQNEKIINLLKENTNENMFDSVEVETQNSKELSDKERKMKDKAIVKVLLGVVLFMFLAPYIVNFIVETPSPLGQGFINDANKDTWITFFGTIIGGGATLIGVWWTIKNQEKKSKEDLAIKYKPVLTASFDDKNKKVLSICDLEQDKTSSSGIFTLKIGNQPENKICIFTIKIINHGDGECYIRSIGNTFIYGNGIKYKKIGLKNTNTPDANRLLLQNGWYNTIVRNRELNIKIRIIYNDKEDINCGLYLSFPLKSTDMFNYKQYDNKFTMSFLIKYNDKNNILEINEGSILIANDVIYK